MVRGNQGRFPGRVLGTRYCQPSAEVRAIADVFNRTEDIQAKELCLLGLGRIENNSAKKELRRIQNDARTAQEWRSLAQEYLVASTADRHRPSIKETTASGSGSQ